MALVQTVNAWFHDSTLDSVHIAGGEITLNVVDARTQNDLPCSVYITLKQVALIKADGEVADTFVMEAEDAEILSLDIDGDGIAMILEWNNWEPRRQFVRSYVIKAHDVRVVAAD